MALAREPIVSTFPAPFDRYTVFPSFAVSVRNLWFLIMMRPMKVAVYARVSTHNGQTTENQLLQLRDCFAARLADTRILAKDFR